MARVVLDHVTKRYGDVVAVNDLSLEIRDREFLVLLGPSGCGKSTALRMIAGLEDLSGGQIAIGDRVVNEIEPKDRDIAMVFQSYALYPHMTVARNIEFPLRSRKVPEEERGPLVAEAARALGLSDLLNRKPAQLSGGERQRVALARAIVRKPAVFLMDEPLSNLDAKLRVQTRAELIELQRRLDATVVYVTHDQVEAMTLADRICVLRDGLVEQVGTPLELYDNPQSLFVAGFIGSPKMNFLDGKYADAYGAKTIGIRSEHMDVVEKNGVWSGEVIHTENLGSDSYVFVEMGTAEPMIVRLNGTSKYKVGDTISVSPMAGKLHCFDAAGKPTAKK